MELKQMKNILILVDCSASINPLHKKLYCEIVKDICNDNYAECVEIYGFSDTLFKLSLEQYMKLKFIDMQYPGFSLALVSHVTFFPNLHKNC